jgi:DNA-directed RNA polymerase I subunit RPA2
MPAMPSTTNTKWSVEYDTSRREKLFRNPPRDHTAYPALRDAIRPHVEAFNALLETGGLVEHGLRDIGTKSFLDGEPGDESRNSLSVRLREVFLDRAQLPPGNKFSTRNREIFPAECRERHVTYRGKMKVKLQYRINSGDWRETIRDLGQVPIMLMVGSRQVLHIRLLGN